MPAGTQPGDPIDVEIRGKRLRAIAVRPPFVRDGKSLIEEVLTEGKP